VAATSGSPEPTHQVDQCGGQVTPSRTPMIPRPVFGGQATCTLKKISI
jgi:hypothetical protein